MKRLFILVLAVGVFASCSNSSNVASDMKDSVDSITKEKKQSIDNAASQAKDTIQKNADSTKKIIDSSAKRATDSLKK
jgi:hypothetical protein